MFRVRVRSFSVRPDLSILNVPAMEAWRQGRTGEKKSVSNNMKPIPLTPTGVLKEGHFTQNPRRG
jgi:hypothetical protein